MEDYENDIDNFDYDVAIKKRVVLYETENSKYPKFIDENTLIAEGFAHLIQASGFIFGMVHEQQKSRKIFNFKSELPNSFPVQCDRYEIYLNNSLVSFHEFYEES
jgi:hypothetical protein